ncbi:MAG: glycosyltransferase family 9 protein [Candidatus Omnitrophica bacterium]|nr:glycosyltransferase family 9 protein [Candidatus Omnitrophota bacterium]
MSRPERILIVNPFGIGDVLFTLPLIRAVRRAFPRSAIVYLCNRRTEGMLRHDPDLNNLVVYEKDELLQCWRASRRQGLRQMARLLRQLRQARFDLAIDLSLGERYSLVLRLLGVRRRVGFDYRRRGRFLTERLAIDGYHNHHVVEYHAKLLAFIGIHARESSLSLQISNEDEAWARTWLRQRGLQDERCLIGIVPAGGASWGIDAPYRRWGLENFAAVGDALATRHQARVLLFGEAVDASACAALRQRMAMPAVDVSGQTTLGQFIALLSHLHLVVCNDGGPLHLAVSRGVRTVSVFGPVDPTVYGPYPLDAARHRVICKGNLPCRPCYHRFKLPPCPYERACLTTVEPSEVIEACEDLLWQDAASTKAGAHA